jgi:hypothetical protein
VRVAEVETGAEVTGPVVAIGLDVALVDVWCGREVLPGPAADDDTNDDKILEDNASDDEILEDDASEDDIRVETADVAADLVWLVKPVEVRLADPRADEDRAPVAEKVAFVLLA